MSLHMIGIVIVLSLKGIVMIEISSKSNEKLKEILELSRSKKAREDKQVVLVDGVKLCLDAVYTGHSLMELWVTESATNKYRQEYERLETVAQEIFVLKDHAAQRLSDLKTPQGIWGVFHRPDPVSLSEIANMKRVLGVCCIQIPENIGAMLRSAAAFGFDGVIMSEDCADIWSPRAIRAGALSQMNLPYCFVGDFAESIHELKNSGIHIYQYRKTPLQIYLLFPRPAERVLYIAGYCFHGISV